MLNSIIVHLSITVHLIYEIWQLDVKIAFLNSHLDFSIDMMKLNIFHSKRLCVYKKVHGSMVVI